MPKRLPPLGPLRVFEAAARLSSFKAAAEELSVTPAAVSQQIKALEEDLGLDLFNRGTRSVTLTAKGAILSEGLSEAFLRIRQSVDAVRASEHAVLNIATSPAIAAKWLTRRLANFTGRYPELSTAISADMAVKPLDGSSDAQVGVRFGRKPPQSLYHKLICHEVLVPLAAPELVERLDLREPKDLVRAPLIHDQTRSDLPLDMPQWRDWYAQNGLDPKGADHGMRFIAAADQAIDAAVAGSGVLLGRLGLSYDEIDRGDLVCPFGPLISLDYAYYVVCRAGAETEECVRVFFDWVVSEHERPRKLRDKLVAQYPLIERAA